MHIRLQNILYLDMGPGYECNIFVLIFIIYPKEKNCRQFLYRRFLSLYQISRYSLLYIYRFLPYIRVFTICVFLYLPVSTSYYTTTNLWLFTRVYLLVYYCRIPNFPLQIYKPDKKLQFCCFTKSHKDYGLLFYYSWISRYESSWITIFLFVFRFPIKNNTLSSFFSQGFRVFIKAGLWLK